MKQALDFIKMHAIALSCGVVALVAIIAYFIYPIPAKFDELQSEVGKRKETYDTLTSLTTAARTLPPIDPGQPEPAKLDVYPTRGVIEKGRDAIKLLDGAAKGVLAEAVKLNQRAPLLPGALPAPTPIARSQFFDAYQIETAQTGDDVDKGMIRRVLKGTLPPTADELTAIEQSLTNDILKNNLQTDARGQPQNQPQVDALVNAMKARLRPEQQVDRALRFQVYVSPGAVEVHPGMQQKENLDAVTMFNAQFALWLQQTVFESIAGANGASASVLDSPIKHLVSLRVPMSVADAAAATGGGSGSGFGAPPAEGGGPPAAVELKPDNAVALTPNYAGNPLGYTHNAMFDPFNVQMVLRVDAARLPEALAGMAQNPFVKVRNVSSVRPVEAGIALSQGYFYSRDGATPMVEVALDCDVLMLREWLVRFMPDPVKLAFNNLSSPAVVAQ